MESRKIQTVGGGTYTVSLPKAWAEDQGISSGDTVNLHTYIDGLLVIEAGVGETDASGCMTIQVAHDGTTFLEQILRAAYAVGVKEVMLTADETFTSDQRRVVDRTVRNLTGVSVTEESDTAITVQTLLDTDEVSVRQSVRQLKFVALSMHRDATKALTGEVSPGGLADRDDQADRLFAMIDRSFSRGLAHLDEVDALGTTRPELFEMWETTRQLERVADHAEGLEAIACRLDAPLEDHIAGDLTDVAQIARDVVADAVSVVLDDTTVVTAQQALLARERVREAVAASEGRLNASPVAGEQRLAYHRIRRTAELGGNVAEMGLRRAIRRGEASGSMPRADVSDDGDHESHASTGQ